MSTNLDTESRLLHETVLRLFKGILRAYEHWFNVRVGKEPPAIELPRSGDKP